MQLYPVSLLACPGFNIISFEGSLVVFKGFLSYIFKGLQSFSLVLPFVSSNVFILPSLPYRVDELSGQSKQSDINLFAVLEEYVSCGHLIQLSTEVVFGIGLYVPAGHAIASLYD